MTAYKELKIAGKRKDILDLVAVLRLNGIEPTVPVAHPDDSGRVSVQCMPSVMLDRILPPWKDSLTCKTITLKR